MVLRFPRYFLQKKGAELGKRFTSDPGLFQRCYQLINGHRHRNEVFWNEIEDTVKLLEKKEANNARITSADLETAQNLKYELSRTYGCESFESLDFVLNKAEHMVESSRSPLR